MILGIESSCDESALALLSDEGAILGEWVQSQILKHAEYGGVVPDLAVGQHLQNFTPLLEIAKGEFDLRGCVNQIAVTCGPGLVGCLAMGISVAKSLGLLWGVPVYGVNHLRGHAYSPFLNFDPARKLDGLLPHLGLLVSGGNTLLFEITTSQKIEVLAKTMDDAAGECLDKGGKLLGIPYPGGAELEQEGKGGDENAFPFPRAFPEKDEMRFSFSGLKTSLLYTLKKMEESDVRKYYKDLCASYQAAVVDQLTRKTEHAIALNDYRSVGLSGGVANNQSLRDGIAEICKAKGIEFLPAAKKHTGDNAAMIAFASLVDSKGVWNNAEQKLTFNPSLKLDDVPSF